jgi:hypothetical protein
LPRFRAEIPAVEPRGTCFGLSAAQEGHVTNFIVYMIGMLLLAGALAYGANIAGISQRWIVVGVLALIGLGVMGGIVKTRQRDPAN